MNGISRVMQVTRRVTSDIASFAISTAWVIPVLLSLSFSCVLIERKWGLFSESFLTKASLKLTHIPVFLVFACLIDLTLIYFFWILWILIGRRLRFSSKTISLSFIIVACTVVGVINIAHYNVIAYLGDVTRINNALNVGGGLGGALPYLMNVLPTIVVYGLVIPLVGLTGYTLLRRLTKRFPLLPPVTLRKQLLTLGICLCGFLSIEVFLTLAPASHPVVANLRRTCLYRIEHPLTRFLTDFDGDGYGLLDNPPDFAPFDSTRHPFALETPGNGIDANGIGGVLPRYDPPESLSTIGTVNSKPDIILIMACTLRYDAVFGGDIGSSAMPQLCELSKHGFSTNRAYSHTGFTTSSMQATLCGRLTSPRRSLIHDFKDANYQVGVFSTHDDSFGDSRRICALDQADRYFDASMDRESRVTASASPSSILVSGQRIIKEATGFLESSKTDRPLFLFAFFASTHYPYTHDSPRNLIPHTRLAASELRAGSREQIVELYRNAAANLDRQISDLIEQVNKHRRGSKPVIIVLGDHGESLFDDGMLGHGLKINDVQTRVPLIIANGWGTVPVPFGQSDLRGYLLQLLSLPRPKQPVVIARLAERPVFQYTGTLSRPQEIGEVTPHRRTMVNLEEHTVQSLQGKPRLLSDQVHDDWALDLIHRWECFSLLAGNRVPDLVPQSLPSNQIELEKLGRQWCQSNSWFQRESGIKILSQFNNHENVEILKKLLHDAQASTADEFNLNTASPEMLNHYNQFVHGVQELAGNTLNGFGVQVTPVMNHKLNVSRQYDSRVLPEPFLENSTVQGAQTADWAGGIMALIALAVLLRCGMIQFRKLCAIIPSTSG